MRVTNASTYRNYTSSINNVHANLNKSLNRISSGRKYETAAENPISYYQGKEIDNQYLETLSKVNLLTDVKARLEQQEKGAYDIQQLLKKGKNDVVLKARTGTTDPTAMATLRADLLQKEQTMVNDLRSQYQDYYVYGGNDSSTPPFSLSADGMSLTFSHKFPGESNVTNFKMDLVEENGAYTFKLATGNDENKRPYGDIEKLVQAMSEQGYMDLGYGDIRSRDTLMDTFTGGMNLLTGLSSDAVKTRYYDSDGNFLKSPTAAPTGSTTEDEIMKYLTDGPLGVMAQSVKAMDSYLNEYDPATGAANPEYGDRDKLDDRLAQLITDMTGAEHVASTVYSDLGNKYNALENTEDRLNKLTDSLKTQYSDAVGADPYESILEMYNNQYAYNAALQVGSNLMQSSLFDFVR